MSRPRLDVLSGDLSGRSYVVDEDEFVIGRGRNCDLVIPKRYISREHARIVRSRSRLAAGALFALRSAGLRQLVMGSERLRNLVESAAFLRRQAD